MTKYILKSDLVAEIEDKAYRSLLKKTPTYNVSQTVINLEKNK